MVVMITIDSDDDALSMYCNKRLSPRMHMLNKEIVTMGVMITIDSDDDDSN